MDAALQMLFPILLGVFGGMELDKRTGMDFVYTTGGAVIGMVMGIGLMYKKAMRQQEAEKRQKQDDQEAS